MSKALQLANRFREVLLDGKWIANTNWQQQLADVTLQQAVYQTANLNTIALLTFHVNYYINGLNHFFEHGELTIRDKFSFDIPELQNESHWEALKQQLFDNANQFAAYVEKLNETELAAVFVKEDYGTYQRNIEGLIEHSYYHLGQVSLLKKLTLTQVQNS
tara:strand:- start:142 stop:624 length:483 start_codon:yes stop_codon:yes gene_type:complete